MEMKNEKSKTNKKTTNEKHGTWQITKQKAWQMKTRKKQQMGITKMKMTNSKIGNGKWGNNTMENDKKNKTQQINTQIQHKQRKANKTKKWSQRAQTTREGYEQTRERANAEPEQRKTNKT